MKLSTEQRELLADLVIEERKAMKFIIENEELPDDELADAIHKNKELNKLIGIL